MNKWIVVATGLGLAGCQSTQTSVPAGTTGLNRNPPPAAGGVQIPAPPASANTGQGMITTGGGVRVPAPTGAASTGVGLNVPRQPAASPGYTRPDTVQ
jgi:hypothetical protein